MTCGGMGTLRVIGESRIERTGRVIAWDFEGDR